MKLTELRLKNFKSVGAEEQVLAFSAITLLFGPNSVGKSTVLQALVFLHEVVNHQNLNHDQTVLGGDAMDLGGFKNLVHGRDDSEAIVIGVSFELDAHEMPDYLSEYEINLLNEAGLPEVQDIFEAVNHASITLTLRWSMLLDAAYVEKYECKLNDETIAVIEASPDGKRVRLESLQLTYEGFSDPLIFEEEGITFIDILAEVLDAGPGQQFTQSRPLRDDSIDDLEKLYEGLEDPKTSKLLLLQLREELEQRTSRRAKNLEGKVVRLLDQSSTVPVREFIELNGLTQALPDTRTGIEIDSELWVPDSDIEEHDRPKKLLARALLDVAICGPLKVLSDWLEELSYIGPLRDLPPRNILPRMSPDSSRWARGLAAWESLPAASDELVKELNYWMGDACLKIGYQLQVKRYRELEDSHPIYLMLESDSETDDRIVMKELLDELHPKVRVSLIEDDTELEVMPQDIGVGVSQIFPVLTMAVTKKDGLAAIEQPELHIHPRLQTELADVFIRYAIQSNVMFLLETHSEHLMLRMLRRVREAENHLNDQKSLSPDDLAVHYVESGSEGTKFSQLRVSEDVDFIDEWPDGFFDERDEELFF